MLFQVTEIEFDFDDFYCAGEELSDEVKDEVYDDVMWRIWEVENEEDLVDEITNHSGWCVKTIDYRHVLS